MIYQANRRPGYAARLSDIRSKPFAPYELLKFSSKNYYTNLTAVWIFLNSFGNFLFSFEIFLNSLEKRLKLLEKVLKVLEKHTKSLEIF